MGEERIVQYGARNWLAEESGVSQRRIWGILSGRERWTSLEVADKLLQAVGMPQATWDGTVHVVPNPEWSEDRWLEHMAERGCDPDVWLHS
jgi:hypothetical protein